MAGVPTDVSYIKTYAGGLIFYLDTLNTDSFKGLLSTPSGQSTGVAWITGGSTKSTVNDNTDISMGTGLANTIAMINQDRYTGGGAKVCLDYEIMEGGVTYSDWFLPSRDELNEMYIILKSNGYGGFSTGNYWSGTEYDY